MLLQVSLIAATETAANNKTVAATARSGQYVPIIGDTDEFLIVASRVQTNEGSFTVVVPSPVQIQTDSVAAAACFLLGATPLVVVGFAVWFLVGRSLRQP